MVYPKRLCFRFATRGAVKRLVVLFALLAVALLWAQCTMIHMPGKSYRGPLPPLTSAQAQLADELRRDVDMLAGIIGRRNVFYPKGMEAAAAFLQRSLADMAYQPQRQWFTVLGQECCNLEVEIKGVTRPDEIVIIGAHYDSVEVSVEDCPAANDNASGVAAVLALARRFAPASAKPNPPSLARRSGEPSRTLRFVLFVNEEPPFFKSDDMGSRVHAKRCKERGENIVSMLSLETIGYYSDQPGSQTYPIKPIGWLYPTTGDFIGFVGNLASRKLVRQVIGSFREHAQFPSQGAALPGWITGVDWSDHWSFWQEGYPAIMVTDTALFRYPHYHTPQDTAEKLDFEGTARVVDGLEKVVRGLAGTPETASVGP